MTTLMTALETARETQRQKIHFGLHKQLHSPSLKSKRVTRRGRTAVIKVTDFATGAGATITDAFPPLPTDGGTWTDRSDTNPLISISSSDINQQTLADCYFLAVLIVLAEFHPDYIRKLLQPDIDANGAPMPGKWVVYFTRNGIWTRVHVSCMVGSIQTAALGDDGDYWPDLMETAYSFYRSGADTYASLNYGYQGAVMSDMGIPRVAELRTVAGQMTAIKAGRMPTLLTGVICPPGTVEQHVYGAIAQQPDLNASVPTKIRYRNPWGVASNLWYDLTDADVAKYFPVGYFVIGDVPSAQVPAPTPAPTPTPVPIQAPPVAPASPLFDQLTRSSVRVRWVVTDPSVTLVTLHRQKKGDAGSSLVVYTCRSDTALFVDRGVTRGATYLYWVEVANAVGSSTSPAGQVTIPKR